MPRALNHRTLVALIPVVAGTLALVAGPARAAAPCKRNCDTTPPAVNVSAPTANSTVAGTVTTSGTASDNVAVSKVEVAVDGGAYQVASGTTTWTWSWNTAGASNSGHTLNVRATDSSGNVKATATSVTVANPVADTTPPSVAVGAPTNGSTVSGSVAVTGTAGDNAAVARVEVAVDGGAYQVASGTTSWSWSWNTATLANGTHTVTARAVDTSANTAAASATVTVANPVADTTAPTVGISSPAPGATVSGTVTVSGTAADNVGLASVQVSVDGGTYQPASGTTTWSWTWNTTSLANGSHTLSARASDAAGNQQAASVTVTVANSGSSWTSPEGVRINVNSAGSWTVSQVYTLLTQSARDLGALGPKLTINVQDVYASQTATSASQTNGVYTGFSATIYLKGVNSNFATNPEAVMAHEFGHAWTMYHLYLSKQGDWSSYLQARNIATDPRLDTTYNWDRKEIIADDYRLLFGSAAAIAEMPGHLNTDLPDPRNVPGLRDFFVNAWSVAGA